ncbi:DUF4345 family protein [Corticibacterium sp. UT-5YL-CI-8]|nr:DUF4345 family protein [Tianweitania sp. UT-5YL-CI-8]
MEFAFPWPLSQGEWLAWTSAAITLLFGIVLFFFPGLSFRLLRLQPRPDVPSALAEGRSIMAGFYLGVGLCCILLAQPLVYLTLGFSWLFTVFGRIIGMLSDNANTPYHWLALIIQLALAILPLGFAFGLWP